MPGLAVADLIFSEQANYSVSKTLGELKRATLSIHNRLESIREDATFADKVAGTYKRPLIANERCGSWYVQPQIKAGSAYFKSTDGHSGYWKFSLRRLNLHLLEIIGKNDGCIIVDSTRRGKRMPDALSKTIPIWCCIMNRLLFPEFLQSHELFAPPNVVSGSEHAQISALLSTFLNSAKSLELDVDNLRAQLSKPLRLIWITPESHLEPTNGISTDYHQVICCTVSKRVAGSEQSEGGYIQGAGDDTENWAHGLIPSVFWQHQELLLSTSESNLPGLIQTLVRGETPGDQSIRIRCILPTSRLFVAPAGYVPSTEKDRKLHTVRLSSTITAQSAWPVEPSMLEVGLGPHKLGSRNLRDALPTILQFARKALGLDTKSSERGKSENSLLISCESGRDFSIGVALALMCLLFTDSGNLTDTIGNQEIDKSFIRRRLSWLSNALPDANPSRATLQSVNSFLMERP